MNYGTALTLLGGLLGDSPSNSAGRLQTYAPFWFDWAMRELLRKIRMASKDGAWFLRGTVVFDTEIMGTGVNYPLPTDFDDLIAVNVQAKAADSPTLHINHPPEVFFLAEASTTAPIASIHGNPAMLRVAPAPSDASFITASYHRCQPFLSKSTDLFVLPDSWNEAILHLAAAKGAALYKSAEIEKWEALAGRIVDDMIGDLNARTPDSDHRIRQTPGMQWEQSRRGK